jgi:hypothetical protein
MSEIASHVPPSNLEVVCHLFRVEVALRELIVAALNIAVGPRWFRQRVPEPIRKDAQSRIADERRSKWTSLVRHHPLYYTNFGELKAVIERQDNWRDAFQKIFDSKEVLIGTLTELDPIRNKVAHNRKATPEDVTLAASACEKIRNTIGPARFDSLVQNCTTAPSIPETMTVLTYEAEACYKAICSFSAIPPLSTWGEIEHAWWFEEEYLGKDIGPITRYFGKVREYRDLPRIRGCGHKLEEWAKNSDLQGSFRAAIDSLHDLTCQPVTI